MARALYRVGDQIPLWNEINAHEKSTALFATRIVQTGYTDKRDFMFALSPERPISWLLCPRNAQFPVCPRIHSGTESRGPAYPCLLSPPTRYRARGISQRMLKLHAMTIVLLDPQPLGYEAYKKSPLQCTGGSKSGSARRSDRTWESPTSQSSAMSAGTDA